MRESPSSPHRFGLKLLYFRAAPGNFGDDLNLWLWPRVFGETFYDIFDDDERSLFIGIGSTIFNHFPATARKIVFGAGFGGYTPPPDVHHDMWRIYFVRGPQTARTLGLKPSVAITDSAILVNRFYKRKTSPRRFKVSFIPHWESVHRGRWEDVCTLAGLHFINPCLPVADVLSEIADSEMIVTEAMHGAIVADALRIPWIALAPIAASNRYKWYDWTESLQISYRAATLWPSTIRESWTIVTRRETNGRAHQLGVTPAVAALETPIIHAAAYRLSRIAKREPSLSRDGAFADALERIDHQVDTFRCDFANERLTANVIGRSATNVPYALGERAYG